jgi:hypothetical protein
MYVKLLDGRFAGEVRDLAPGAARDLIELGRAERAFQDPAPEAPIVVASHPVESVQAVYVDGQPAQIVSPAEKKKKTR